MAVPHVIDFKLTRLMRVGLQMAGMIPIDMAHTEPDGVERRQEGKRQHRANGCASDQHIGPIRLLYRLLVSPG